MRKVGCNVHTAPLRVGLELILATLLISSNRHAVVLCACFLQHTLSQSHSLLHNAFSHCPLSLIWNAPTPPHRIECLGAEFSTWLTAGRWTHSPKSLSNPPIDNAGDVSWCEQLCVDPLNEHSCPDATDLVTPPSPPSPLVTALISVTASQRQWEANQNLIGTPNSCNKLWILGRYVRESSSLHTAHVRSFVGVCRGRPLCCSRACAFTSCIYYASYFFAIGICVCIFMCACVFAAWTIVTGLFERGCEESTSKAP